MSDAGGMPPSYTGPVPEKETTAYKAAKLAVIVLSALIVLAVIALIVGGIARLSGKPSAAVRTGGTSFQLPPGARIVSMDTQPGRLILRVRAGQGEEIDIFDIQNGQLVGQVKASVGPPR
jgi:hypothetical protein